MITGTEFVKTYGPKGPDAWESAVLAHARQDDLTPWPWVNLPLADAEGNTAVLRVQTDVLSVGPTQDFLRLPMRPIFAQNVLNLFGWLMPTPWLVYKMFQASALKLTPIPAQTNLGPNIAQYARHSQQINAQIAAKGGAPPSGLISGLKKAVIVSNIYLPGKVLIFGWYWPPPAPDVYDDGKPWQDPSRQPIQAKSNEHGENYVDYSHGIHCVGPECIVNGQPMNTVDLYQHPTLYKLVSNEGAPVRVPRYPSQVVPTKNLPTNQTTPGRVARNVEVLPHLPAVSDQALDNLIPVKRG